MPPPPIESIPTDNDIDKAKIYNDIAQKTKEKIDEQIDSVNLAKTAFSNFDSVISETTDILNILKNKIGENNQTLGLLTTGLVGVKKHFESLSGIDLKSLSTFRSQFDDLVNTVKNSPIGSIAAETAKSGITALLKAAHVPAEQIKQIISGPVEMISKLGGAFIDSADNGLKASNVMVQLAGKTGALGQMYRAAGQELEGLDSMLHQQAAIMSDVEKATNLPIETIHKYYVELGTIPGAIQAIIKGNAGASNSFSMLAGAIKLAKGAGRETEEVIGDLKVAYQNYNITGDDALNFVARMTELNNKFGGSFNVVRDALHRLSSDFMIFGNNAESATQILNNYVGGLKATGLSGDKAIGIVTDMTKSITQMSLAQRAFLSAQSGGPGGLMGGYKIEDMMRKGKSAEVMDMYIKQIQKLSGGGKMVTVEEASKSQSAAAQLTKQTQLLQSFGIGKGSEAEAHRIIEGLRKRQEGIGGEELTKDFSQQLMTRGTQLQQLSATDWGQARSELDGLQVHADITNFGTMKQIFGASVGPAGEFSTKEQSIQRQRIRNEMEKASISSGDRTKKAKLALTGAPNSGIMIPGNYLRQQVDKSSQHISDISLSGYKDSFKKTFNIHDRTINQNKQEQSLKNERDRRILLDKQQSSANVVGAAANRATGVMGANRQRAGAPGAPGNPDGRVGVAALPPGKLGELTVHIDGYCIKCKREIEGGAQAAAVNPVGMRT